MSRLGFVILAHEPLDRALQITRYWASAGCPIVVHLDKSVSREAHASFVKALEDLPGVLFGRRLRCEWGTWSLVQATLDATRLLLEQFPSVRHVYLASGSCLPLRPVSELQTFLDANPDTDFIESVTTRDVPWTIGGLDAERFTLSFPFAWRRRRRLFDLTVELQRKLNLSRRIPQEIEPHLGSQWWCLTRKTLEALLGDPRRRKFEKYFKRVWIPDESYFQTLVRLYSERIEGRALTLSRFDYQGKPHVFYDDHLQLLRRSDCFVVRKVWPGANQLYDTFLGDGLEHFNPAPPAPVRIERSFSRAGERRQVGRSGLYMQSRFPRQFEENGKSAAPYTVLSGFDELYEDFEAWLSRTTECRTHGHLYAPERAVFADGHTDFAGGLTDNARLRDYNPNAFLTNLIWSTRGERQVFQFGPDDRQEIAKFTSVDANAHIWVISGAWSIQLFRSGRDISVLREEAARLQRIETDYIRLLRSRETKARVRIWTLAEYLNAPIERLQILSAETRLRDGHALFEAPQMANLDAFPEFLRALHNDGLQLHLVGDIGSLKGMPVVTHKAAAPRVVH